MAFNVVVGITAAPGATAQIDQFEQGLDDVSQAAGRATTAIRGLGEGTAAGMSKAEASLDRARAKFDEQMTSMDKLLAQGRITQETYSQAAKLYEKAFDNSLAGDVKTLADALERVNAPFQRYEQDLAALDISLRKGQLSLEQYEAALEKVQNQAERGGALAPKMGPAFDLSKAGLANPVNSPMQGPAYDQSKAGQGLSEELRREQQILEKINGPMREYQAQVAALDRLLEKGTIDAADYNRELERAGKATGKGLNPVQGPKQQSAAAGAGAGAAADGAGTGDYFKAIAPQLGQGGQMLSQFASGGVLAAAGTAALVVELGHLSDEYTTLTNKVERFSTTTMSADDILHQELDLSRELHSNLEATATLYVKVRDSTNQLNLSQREQQELAKDIGVAVAAEGKSAEEAAALTQRLGIAFETGTINGREMRSLMKQYPEIANELSQALGHTQSQLLQMANKGQISAQQLIDAFHKMEPEAEATLKRLDETFSQRAGHLWDSVKLSVGGALKDYLDSYKSPSEIAEAYAARKLHEHQEAARQLTAELEKNTRTAEIANAGHEVGVDVGPFSKELADKITGVRMTARQAGVDIADAFANAKAKAQLYGTEIDKIREQHAAKEIADDAKRMYDATEGATNILTKQMDKWRDIGLQVVTITKAIERWRMLDAGAPPSRERTELERQKRDLLTELDNKPFGEDVTKYRQGLDKARDGLEDWRAAAKAGTISQEELRKKTDEFLTTLNDGRLPEAIKIWEGLNLPVEQSIRDFAALDALFKSNRIGVSSYTNELKKIADHNPDAAEVSRGIERIHQQIDRGMRSWSDYDGAVRKLVDSLGKYQTTASGIRFRAEIKGPDEPSSLLPKNSQPVAPKGLTDNPELKGILAEYQSSGIAQGASMDAAQLNDELERGIRAMDDFIAPSVKYEQRIKEIGLAVRFGGFSEEQISAARRRAKDTLNQETEALEAQKGPMEAYEAALRKLKDQLDAGDISQRKYAEGVDKAKLAMLDATGAAKTFAGAMEINWVKLKQEAEGFGATVADMAVADFGKLNDAIVTAANGGAVSFSQMADSMIQDLQRVALKMLEIKLIESAAGLFSGIGGDGGGLADTSNYGAAFGAGNYATGGSFLVGGDGGVDTTPIAFRATRGERVTISQPGAYPYPSPPSSGGGGVAGGGGATVVHVHNHYDSAISQAALDGPGGQTSVMNTLRLRAGAVRNLTSRPRRA